MFFKKFIYAFIFLIFLLEISFQALASTDLNFFKKPILFFNPYCDQDYWARQQMTKIDEDVYTYHPILSIIKKNKIIPHTFDSNIKKKNINKEIIFYGSSFIDHKIFMRIFKDYKNYAVKSYGLDQIYLSYKLTKNNHYGDTIVIGFLLEDLDRVIFNSRNYNKINFSKKEGDFILNGNPVDIKKKIEKKNYFYSFHLFKSLFFLISNNYDYKMSNCRINFKKDFFVYFIENLKKEAKQLNQNLIIITFNFKDDINENKNWRYSFIKNLLLENNINHIDTKKLIETHIKKNNLIKDDFYSYDDLHFNNLSNEILKKNFLDVIEQYK